MVKFDIRHTFEPGFAVESCGSFCVLDKHQIAIVIILRHIKHTICGENGEMLILHSRHYYSSDIFKALKPEPGAGSAARDPPRRASEEPSRFVSLKSMNWRPKGGPETSLTAMFQIKMPINTYHIFQVFLSRPEDCYTKLCRNCRKHGEPEHFK